MVSYDLITYKFRSQSYYSGYQFTLDCIPEVSHFIMGLYINEAKREGAHFYLSPKTLLQILDVNENFKCTIFLNPYLPYLFVSMLNK